MKFPWRFCCRRRPEWCGAATLLLASVAPACGPEFPNSYYAMADGELLAAPEGFFAAEIARLMPPAAPPHRAVRTPGGNPRAQTVEIDIADVRQALAERGAASPEQVRWQYEEVRRALEEWVSGLHAVDGTRVSAPWPEPPALNLSPLVPAEFRLYLKGAVAWHQRHLDEARAAWTEVLALPESERKFRSVWANFMLGRLAVTVVEQTPRDEHPAFATAQAEVSGRMRAVRELVAAGLPDPLGLAAASFGWEAKAALVACDYPTAMGLYLQQHATGDVTAVASLQRTARDAIACEGGESGYAAIARDTNARRVVTAYFVARGMPSYGEVRPLSAQLKQWAEALEEAGIDAVPDADRLAWLAYEAGLFALAERWAALASEGSAEARWIRAKLALRGGNLPGGESLLRAALATGRLGEAHRQRVLAELGRVCLSRDDFKGALATALEGGHWEDAAFVAERVMTLNELRDFVDAQPAVPAAAGAELADIWQFSGQPERLRHLLARRLMRAGRVDEAVRYFPPEWRGGVAAYVFDVRAGFDLSRPATERAQAFWRAARVARDQGMALLGTELEPDWAIWEGLHDMVPSTTARRTGPGSSGGVLAPTPIELERLKKQASPGKRFHYRYRAAELAWWAASLLPNDSDETAEILNTAGGWLKARDPQAAQPFYQALVIRCGNTALGRAATVQHWFPRPASPAEN